MLSSITRASRRLRRPLLSRALSSLAVRLAPQHRAVAVTQLNQQPVIKQQQVVKQQMQQMQQMQQVRWFSDDGTHPDFASTRKAASSSDGEDAEYAKVVETIENDIKSHKVFVYMKGVPQAPRVTINFYVVDVRCCSLGLMID
eukprot:TRINITY_DN65831_c6_g2_i2.p1 TRINITY_DN65831_c6_g2~~TRINITY_DN65831_c6_g2_i2.p1  ORF type:complete len:143 (+),score=57.17 TRINITY_DN65831_c6_g2_i2:2-430(+)